MSRNALRLLAASILALMAALSGAAAWRESVTVDEVTHLAAGASYLQKLDLRMNVEHPPLAKLLAALPVVLAGAHADYRSPAWTFAQEGLLPAFLAQWSFGHQFLTRWNSPAATLALGRLPMLLLTLALGVLLYLYGVQLGGPSGGLLAVALYASMPAFLAFGPLVITDIPIAFFVLLTLWTFAALWDPAHEPRRVWPFAFALAGALLTKFSAGILIFAFLALRLSLRARPLDALPGTPPQTLPWRKARWRATLRGVLLSALIVYAVYFVFSLRQPTDSLAILGNNPASLVLRRLLMPPWTYLRGLALFAVMSVRPTFLLGHSYSHGVWFYFPVVFALKTPLAALAIFLLAIPVGLLARRRSPATPIVPPDRQIYWRALWIFLLIFTIFCLVSQTTISIRHFTTPMALMILAVSPFPRALGVLRHSGSPAARTLGWLTVALAAAAIVTTVSAYPYYMPYLNSLGRGRPNFFLVNDSNLDWNQSLPEVRRFADQRRIDRLPLDAYGFSDPAVYVPQAAIWNCQTPAPSDAGRWVIVSAGMILDGHNCGWLTHYSSQVLAGGSMYAFHLPSPIPPAGDPAGSPLPGAYRALGGIGGAVDIAALLQRCILDPNQLRPTMASMMAQFQSAKPR
ncbi:MAG: glycosyltransferase family 39 protein [Candidatus Solibacter sp.]